MKSRIKHAVAAVLSGSFLALATANASITFTGNQGDLTFFYESAADRWDIVFRDKGDTQASGLGVNMYGGFTGIVGSSSGDNTFTTLLVNVTSAVEQNLNGNDYLITPANGSTIYTNINQPDLGVRFRLREDEVELGNPLGNPAANQFESARLSLDWDASTKPVGANFAMFGWDVSGNPADVLYETASGNPADLTHDWGNWGHSHWHFGFSEEGDYSLVFNVDGIGGTYGGTDTPSQVTLNFSVVPEPSSALLGMVALAVATLRRRR